MTLPIASASGQTARLAWTLAIAAVAIIGFWIKGDVLLSDPDTQWHIGVGRLMWETGAMPRVDTMSHTFAGQPWIAKEWLSQLVIFSAYALGGWGGVFALGAVALAACVAIIAWRLLGAAPPLLTILICWVVLASLLLISSVRPHLMALPVMALFTILLIRAAEGDQSPPWLALPVMTLWANLHAAFTLGFVIAGFMALDALLRTPADRRAGQVLRWGVFGAALLAATCVHPYGLQSLLINIDMMRGNESIPLIGEWDRHEILGPTGYRILVPALMILSLAAAGRVNAARVGLGLFMLYLAWKHQRFVMLLAVVAPLISRDAFVAGFRTVLDRLRLFRDADPLRNPAVATPVMIGGMAAVVTIPLLTAPPAPLGLIAPTKALAAVPAEMRARPVYNSYNFGGFLVFHRVPTFIDGRTDQLFNTDFMARLYRYLKAGDRDAFLAFIESHGVRWAIVQKGHKETELMDAAPNWRETYSDDEAKVFVRIEG